MDPIDELKSEHRAMGLALKILRRISQRIGESGAIPDPGDMDRLIAFFRGFFDARHQQKEASVLFPAIEAAGLSGQAEAIGGMLAVHAHSRNHLQAMAAALADYREGHSQAADELRLRADAYAQLLETHIAAEEGGLFQTVRASLGAEEMQNLQRGLSRFRLPDTDAERGDDLLQMLESLAEAYPD